MITSKAATNRNPFKLGKNDFVIDTAFVKVIVFFKKIDPDKILWFCPWSDLDLVYARIIIDQ